MTIDTLRLSAEEANRLVAGGEVSSDELYRAYLWRLNISADHQGGGYGRFAVEALCAEAVRRGLRKLTVSYHPGGSGPEGFYLLLGFRPTGEYNQGEVVAERLLVP